MYVEMYETLTILVLILTTSEWLFFSQNIIYHLTADALKYLATRSIITKPHGIVYDTKSLRHSDMSVCMSMTSFNSDLFLQTTFYRIQDPAAAEVPHMATCYNIKLKRGLFDIILVINKPYSMKYSGK